MNNVGQGRRKALVAVIHLLQLLFLAFLGSSQLHVPEVALTLELGSQMVDLEVEMCHVVVHNPSEAPVEIGGGVDVRQYLSPDLVNFPLDSQALLDDLSLHFSDVLNFLGRLFDDVFVVDVRDVGLEKLHRLGQLYKFVIVHCVLRLASAN